MLIFINALSNLGAPTLLARSSTDLASRLLLSSCPMMTFFSFFSSFKNVKKLASQLITKKFILKKTSSKNKESITNLSMIILLKSSRIILTKSSSFILEKSSRFYEKQSKIYSIQKKLSETFIAMNL